jgi:hypothetical protein
MTQALHLINGESVTRRLADANSRLARLVQTAKITDSQIVEELYLAVLCRFPRPEERTLWQKHFAAADKLKASQDLAWVLFNTREFLFNH